MAKTYLDEIVNYPAKVIQELSKNQNFVSLLVDIPNADINEEEVETLWDNCMHDYDYVDGIIQDGTAFCCIDTRIVRDSATIKFVDISVVIGIPHSKMSLAKTGFTGIRGNRRDNLIRELDYTLRDSRAFGIGGLAPYGAIETVSIAGKEFACKRAVYRSSDFAKPTEINR